MKIRSKSIKRWLSLILMVTLMLGMAACGKEQSNRKKEEHVMDTEHVLTNISSMLLENTPQPTYGSVGGEWLVFGLSRWGEEVPQEYYDRYYDAVETYIQECEGVLDERKYTEYSRVIIALTSIAKNPMNVGGYNLLVPLADYEQTIFQGINGPVYALLALDSGNYDIPENITENTQATRELYIDYILSKEIEGGGWSLSGGDAEIDMTAMTLQALAKYQDRQDVAEAIERAVEFLSEQQKEDGGYIIYDAENSETISQVIVALTELGISIEDDRFVKNDCTLEDRLFDFMAEDGGFKHTLDGDSDMIATEQAFYALVALHRMEQGMPSLYRIFPIV